MAKKGTWIGFALLLLLAVPMGRGQQRSASHDGGVNPVIPGYFADPTLKKFGDLYYIYATTDNEMLASGVPTVWVSKDFKIWYNHTMEVPSLSQVQLKNFWAPDIIQGRDGRYYLYFGNCQAGCNIYGYVSGSPVGPWEKLKPDDTPVIPHHYPREGFPSLDAQFFRDDDDRIYAYWGTWVHYNGGYAVGELDTMTMADIKNPANIPIEQTPEPFEAAYMMKKGDKYIFMYSGGSCHDHTYHVRYSHSDSPYGPFVPGENNPILATNGDGSVHGPGHHSVLEENGLYYIAYHKHDWPMTRGGMSRQVCVEPLVFANDSTLLEVVPGAKGLQELERLPGPVNLALGAEARASSSYSLDLPELKFVYGPSLAADDHNATLWKAGDNGFPQNLTLDLGTIEKVERIMVQFEFASYYYRYLLEYSKDGTSWKTYADRSRNRLAGSPMIDDNSVEARYLRLTVLDTEKTGLYAAVWNMKVYGSLFEIPLELTSKASQEGPGAKSHKKRLFAIRAEDFRKGDFRSMSSLSSMGGNFEKTGDVDLVLDPQGIAAFEFKKGALVLQGPVPESLGWNGAFTVASWVKNPQIDSQGECLLSWCDRFRYHLANSYTALHFNSGDYGAAAHLDPHFDMKFKALPSAGAWHHIVLTFDGMVERVYVDGQLDNAQIMLLSSQIDRAKIRIGASDQGEHYTGLMASMQMYDHALDPQEILELMESSRPRAKK